MFAIYGNMALADFDEEEGLALSYGDEDFVSIATGRKQPIGKAPAVASVITSDEISLVGAKDLSEVLELVPGLHVSRKAGGYGDVFVVRGIFSEFNPQILVLINGIPVTNLQFGNRGEAWAGMPVESISRIEVIRGPGSAVYGADAFAGTINIVTKSAQELSGYRAGLSVGSFDETRFWASLGGHVAGWDAGVSLELLDTDGQDEKISVDAQSIFDGLMFTQASLAPGEVSLGRENIDLRVELERSNWKIRLGYQGRQDAGVGAGAGQALDPVGHGESDRINFDVTYQNNEAFQFWDIEARVSYFDSSTETNLILYPPGAFDTIFPGGFPEGVIGQPDVHERHYRFDASAFYTGIEGHDIRVGAGFHYLDQYKIEESKNYFIMPTPGGPLPVPMGGLVDVSDTAPYNREEEREVFYLFIQDEWKLMRDWSLTAGLRYDHYSDFGDTVNPRFALVWDTAYNLTTKLLYGRAFRAPSFAEQFNINNPVAIGNDNLDPETIDTYELAFDYVHSERLRMGLNLFYYRMEDIIKFTPVAQNTGDQTGHGLEWEFEWKASDNLTFKGNYAYQSSEDRDTDSDAPNAPQQQIYLRADYRFSHQWSINSQVNHVMDRERAFGDLRPDIDDYTILDLTLRGKDLFPGVDVAISVRNLTDEDAAEPSLGSAQAPALIPNDLPLAGRSIFAEIRKTW